MPNIHDLDTTLCFGDPKQISAVKAFEAGWKACKDCGALYEPTSDSLGPDAGYCEDCLVLWD